MYVRTMDSRPRRRRRILGCFRTRFTIIIRRHTSTGVPCVYTEVGYVGTERYLGSTSRSPSLHRPLPSFSLILRNPLPLRRRPLLLDALLLLAFPRPWTAVKQSRSASPPLTIRIKPFNCRIVFDGSFSPAKLLFKLVPGYVRTSGDRLLPLVSPCSITFTRNVMFFTRFDNPFLFSVTDLLFVDMLRQFAGKAPSGSNLRFLR